LGLNTENATPLRKTAKLTQLNEKEINQMQPTQEKYKYEYQGQEHQTELCLNWSSFKYSN